MYFGLKAKSRTGIKLFLKTLFMNGTIAFFQVLQLQSNIEMQGDTFDTLHMQYLTYMSKVLLNFVHSNIVT